jgi:hypothetical protein
MLLLSSIFPLVAYYKFKQTSDRYFVMVLVQQLPEHYQEPAAAGTGRPLSGAGSQHTSENPGLPVLFSEILFSSGNRRGGAQRFTHVRE